MFEFQFKGDRAMTGLAIIATGLMAGYGPWRGKQVESRNNVVDEFSQSYNYNNQTMGFESLIPCFKSLVFTRLFSFRVACRVASYFQSKYLFSYLPLFFPY